MYECLHEKKSVGKHGSYYHTQNVTENIINIYSYCIVIGNIKNVEFRRNNIISFKGFYRQWIIGTLLNYSKIVYFKNLINIHKNKKLWNETIGKNERLKSNINIWEISKI